MARSQLITVRKGTVASWTAANPVLDAGELGAETDTGRLKIGDGATAWTSLPYVGIRDSLIVTVGAVASLGNNVLTDLALSGGSSKGNASAFTVGATGITINKAGRYRAGFAGFVTVNHTLGAAINAQAQIWLGGSLLTRSVLDIFDSSSSASHGACVATEFDATAGAVCKFSVVATSTGFTSASFSPQSTGYLSRID